MQQQSVLEKVFKTGLCETAWSDTVARTTVQGLQAPLVLEGKEICMHLVKAKLGTHQEVPGQLELTGPHSLHPRVSHRQ